MTSTAAGAVGTGARTTPPWSAGVLLACLVLASINLRSTLSVVPPLVETISADLGLTSAAAGLLTTLPVACMGLFAPLAQRLAVRIGREGVVLVAVVVLSLGSLLRLWGDDLRLLYGGTLLTGVGIAAAGTVLPAVVKEFFAGRAGAVTGVYVLAMGIGGVAASALAAPLALQFDSWQRSLAVWAVPAVVASLAWALLVLRGRGSRQAVPAPVGAAASGLPWRSPTARLTAAFMAGSSLQFYSQLAWLAPAYEELGWTPSETGLLMAVNGAAMVVGGIVAPALTDVVRDRRTLTLPLLALLAVCLAGVLWAPEAAPWIWMIGLGIPVGALFSLGLVMLVDYGATPAASARLAAMVFLIGYSVASTGPIVGGVLRDLAGSFDATFGCLLVLVVGQIAVASVLAPDREKVD